MIEVQYGFLFKQSGKIRPAHLLNWKIRFDYKTLPRQASGFNNICGGVLAHFDHFRGTLNQILWHGGARAFRRQCTV